MKEKVEKRNDLEQSTQEIVQILDELTVAVRARLAKLNAIIATLKQKCQETEHKNLAAREILDQVIPELESLLKEIEEKQCQ